MPLTVTTGLTSLVNKRSVTLGGNITEVDTSASVRGFQYNTTAYPSMETSEAGTFGTGAYTLSVENLTPGTTYYYRAFATDGSGTSYGSWQTFTTDSPTYNVTIDGTDRTTDILNETLVIEDNLNDKQNTCSFSMMNLSGNGIPETDDEITITLDDGTKLFGGYVLSVKIAKQQSGAAIAQITCIDYVWLLDRNLVSKSYTDMTDAEIINDIINTYCAGADITTTNVVEGVTIDQITFNYIQVSQALRRIADLTGRNWYIDYNKDIHYFPLTTNPAPFNITNSNNEYIDLQITKDGSQIKNRVYVRGGTKLSDTTEFSRKGDGSTRKIILPDKSHNVAVTINGVNKTVGIKNIDTEGYDWYLNFQEKYIEQDPAGVTLTSSDVFLMSYQYDIPILVAVEDSASIIANGQKEFAIFDKSISTQQAARDRASAELTDYANDLIEGRFKTYTAGFRAGQYMTINLSDYGINAQYIIQKVVARSFGAGNYQYEVSIASAKTMGIIRFLIELLEANKNLIEVNDQEVVDNLLSVTDSLNADSLVDELTIDSAGPYRTWAVDSLEITNTRAIWNLFQW